MKKLIHSIIIGALLLSLASGLIACDEEKPKAPQTTDAPTEATENYI